MGSVQSILEEILREVEPTHTQKEGAQRSHNHLRELLRLAIRPSNPSTMSTSSLKSIRLLGTGLSPSEIRSPMQCSPPF
jgi:hypothetical protein